MAKDVWEVLYSLCGGDERWGGATNAILHVVISQKFGVVCYKIWNAKDETPKSLSTFKPPKQQKKSPFTVNWVTPTDHNSRKTMFCCEYMTFTMPSIDFIKLYTIVDSFSSVIYQIWNLMLKIRLFPAHLCQPSLQIYTKLVESSFWAFSKCKRAAEHWFYRAMNNGWAYNSYFQITLLLCLPSETPIHVQGPCIIMSFQKSCLQDLGRRGSTFIQHAEWCSKSRHAKGWSFLGRERERERWRRDWRLTFSSWQHHNEWFWNFGTQIPRTAPIKLLPTLI
jgi:hypothetical protein